VVYQGTDGFERLIFHNQWSTQKKEGKDTSQISKKNLF